MKKVKKKIDRSGFVKVNDKNVVWAKCTQRTSEGWISLKELDLKFEDVAKGDTLKDGVVTKAKKYNMREIFISAVSADIDGTLIVGTGKPRWVECVKRNAFEALNPDDCIEMCAWWKSKP